MSGLQKGRQEGPAAGSGFGRVWWDADHEVLSPATSWDTRSAHSWDQSRDRASPASQNYATTIQRPPIAPAKTLPATLRSACGSETEPDGRIRSLGCLSWPRSTTHLSIGGSAECQTAPQ